MEWHKRVAWTSHSRYNGRRMVGTATVAESMVNFEIKAVSLATDGAGLRVL